MAKSMTWKLQAFNEPLKACTFQAIPFIEIIQASTFRKLAQIFATYRKIVQRFASAKTPEIGELGFQSFQSVYIETCPPRITNSALHSLSQEIINEIKKKNETRLKYTLMNNSNTS